MDFAIPERTRQIVEHVRGIVRHEVMPLESELGGSFAAIEPRLRAVRDKVRAAQEFPTEGNLARAPSGRSVAVFTSAGVVVAAMQQALGLDDDKALGLAWHMRNSSVSEFLFSDERFSVLSFNSVPHLSEAQMITLR